MAYTTIHQRSLKETLFWAFTMTWGTQVIGNGVSLLLAIILGPKEFGTVAIAFVFLNLLQVLMNQGMEDTLVQRLELQEGHLNSAFWFLIASGLVLMGITMGLSGWWAALNHQALVGSILKALSVKIPIYSLIIVQRAMMVRQLGFKSLAVLINVAELTAGLIGIGLAVAGAGLWSLVGQQLGRDVITMALLWKMGTWRPKLQFSWHDIKALLPFSGPMFIADLGSYVRSQVDTMLVGLFFGPVAVGLYRLADRIRDSLLVLVTRTLQWVSLPNLSKLQHDPVRLKSTYLKLLRVSLTITLPIMISLASASDLLVGVMGAKWYAAATAISILCLLGSFEGFTVLTTPLLQARSKPFAVAAMVWVFGLLNAGATATCGGLLQGSPVSSQVNGMALCKLGVMVVGFLPVNIFMAMRTSGASVRDLAGATASGAGAAFVAFVIIWAMKTVALPKHFPAAVSLGLALGIAFPVIAILVLWREEDWRIQLISSVKRRLALKSL